MGNGGVKVLCFPVNLKWQVGVFCGQIQLSVISLPQPSQKKIPQTDLVVGLIEHWWSRGVQGWKGQKIGSQNTQTEYQGGEGGSKEDEEVEGEDKPANRWSWSVFMHQTIVNLQIDGLGDSGASFPE
ncbi:hypothetical protein L1887_09470 [Cichorium endivia]|nr:hypothetical protein L1887_09470 [Cichorium endivia]